MTIMFACSKNTETGISLEVTGTNSFAQARGSEFINKSTSAEGFSFTQALLGIKEIEIEGKEEHENEELESAPEKEDEYEFGGKFLVDLLNGTSSPEIGFRDFIPGIYTNFEAETAGIVDGNKSVFLKGSYTDTQDKKYEFEFSTTAEIEFEYESETGYELTEDNILDLVIKINLPSLFTGVDFSLGTMNADNIIVINETSNIGIFKIVKYNLNSMAEMDEVDHDDAIDD